MMSVKEPRPDRALSTAVSSGDGCGSQGLFPPMTSCAGGDADLPGPPHGTHWKQDLERVTSWGHGLPGSRRQ